MRVCVRINSQLASMKRFLKILVAVNMLTISQSFQLNPIEKIPITFSETALQYSWESYHFDPGV